jgi:hypothetical protein
MKLATMSPVGAPEYNQAAWSLVTEAIAKMSAPNGDQFVASHTE